MITRRKLLLVGLLCTSLSWTAQPVGAEDPNASNPPRVSGPLVGSPLGCEDDGPAGPGEAKWQACSWHYQLAGDGNFEEDFSAYWLQMEIDPGKGLCAKGMSFKISDLNGVRIVSAVPRRSSRIPKSRSITTELVVDAEGSAPVPGTVAQDGLLGPGRTTVRRDEDSYSYR